MIVLDELKNKIFLSFRDASIQKLSTLQLSDCRYRSRPKHLTTLLEQFLRGKGLETGMWMLLQDRCRRDLSDFQWKNTLLPLAAHVGQLLYVRYTRLHTNFFWQYFDYNIAIFLSIGGP